MLVLAAVPADQCHKLRRAAAPRCGELLAHEEARSAARRLLDRLAGVLAPLRGGRGGVVEEVLGAPAELQPVQQVAARARVDRRPFERWFARLRLPSPRHFLAAARVLYAHRLLQDPGFTIDDVAQRDRKSVV